jgi:cob(I)alamin adenosyltransferase
MGNRLTQIATRTGDNGTTGLGDNQRVSKNSLRVHAMGDVDELNSQTWACCSAKPMPDEVRNLLVEIQHQLFNLGGELSRFPALSCSSPRPWLALDEALATPQRTAAAAAGVHPARRQPRGAALAHVCRTVARRAERAVVALGNEEALKETPAPVPEPA